MRQQKYRYYFQHEETGYTTFKEYDLEEIESYDGIQIPHRYFIIARCQFTGLFSKDGVEICEGDIVKYDFNNENYRIEFLNAEFIARRFYKNIENLYPTEFDYGKECEVIGSIYEHSHLLDNN